MLLRCLMPWKSNVRGDLIDVPSGVAEVLIRRGFAEYVTPLGKAMTMNQTTGTIEPYAILNANNGAH